MIWTMIFEMNEMEMNDKMNELDFGASINRLTLVNEVNEMKVTRQICNISLLKYMKMRIFFFRVLQSS